MFTVDFGEVKATLAEYQDKGFQICLSAQHLSTSKCVDDDKEKKKVSAKLNESSTNRQFTLKLLKNSR